MVKKVNLNWFKLWMRVFVCHKCKYNKKECEDINYINGFRFMKYSNKYTEGVCLSGGKELDWNVEFGIPKYGGNKIWER